MRRAAFVLLLLAVAVALTGGRFRKKPGEADAKLICTHTHGEVFSFEGEKGHGLEYALCGDGISAKMRKRTLIPMESPGHASNLWWTEWEGLPEALCATHEGIHFWADGNTIWCKDTSYFTFKCNAWAEADFEGQIIFEASHPEDTGLPLPVISARVHKAPCDVRRDLCTAIVCSPVDHSTSSSTSTTTTPTATTTTEQSI